MDPTPLRLTVNVLGEPALAQDGRSVACGSKKALALFLFLVVTGRRHARSAVAAILWGGDPEAARTSLRTALQRLPPELSRCIDAQRDTLGLSEGAAIELDAASFVAFAEEDTLASLEAASELYRGEFLQAFDPDAPPAFEDWAVAERTRYRQLAQSVFDRVIGRHREVALRDAAAAARARASAFAAARRWLAVEPVAEAAHRWLMQLLIETGQQEAARAQYDLCRRALAVGLGRAPAPETRALYDSLGDEAPSAPAMVSGLHDALVPATSFVGRLEDLAALDRLLSDPACRLLTLHGMGGSGKTRLAHVIAQQVLPRFAQGATWLALETVQSAEDAANALARALGIEAAAARHGGRAAVCAALRRQQRLLVFDSAEHLMGADAPEGGFVDLLLAILAAAPGVRILFTSREVLGVAEEWVYEVGGLPLPSSADAGPGEGAAELFIQRARQVYLGFSPAAEWPHVARICRLVEGLPLAIELAAAWVRTVPCGEIASQLEQRGTDQPESDRRDARSRPLDLDAVVAYSWHQLDARLQGGLAALSAFAAAFTYESARQVADASLRQVSALIDKALVQRRPDGRLALHPIVRGFAAKRLAERVDDADAVAHRHAERFSDLLQRCRSRLDGPDEVAAEDELNAERPEIARAVEYWFERARADRCGACAEPALRMLIARGAFREADRLAARVLGLERLGAPSRATALAMRARARSLLGDRTGAASDFRAARELAESSSLSYIAAYAAVYATALPYETGDIGGALANLDALEPAAAAWSPDLRMRLHYTRGVVLDSAGELDGAQAALQAALAIAREMAAPIAIATCESQLATVSLRRGRMDAAVPLLQSALAVFERIGRLHDVARLSNALAVAALWTGDGAAAEVKAREALRLFEVVGYDAGQSAAADTLGQALLRQGRVDEARRCFERAIEVVAGTAMTYEPGYHLVEALLRAGERGAAGAVVSRMARDADRYTQHAAVARYTLAAAARFASSVDSERAARWAAALLSDPELDPDLRGAAETLVPGASMHAHKTVDWIEFRDDVAEFLRRAGS